MWPWLLIGWPVLGAFSLVAWSSRKPADMATQAAEDVEQAAYLADWSARHEAYQQALENHDTRLMNARWPALRAATIAMLRAELGR